MERKWSAKKILETPIDTRFYGTMPKRYDAEAKLNATDTFKLDESMKAKLSSSLFYGKNHGTWIRHNHPILFEEFYNDMVDKASNEGKA